MNGYVQDIESIAIGNNDFRRILYMYAPPNHRDGVVHHTRAAAEADAEHFDGKTSE